MAQEAQQPQQGGRRIRIIGQAILENPDGSRETLREWQGECVDESDLYPGNFERLIQQYKEEVGPIDWKLVRKIRP